MTEVHIQDPEPYQVPSTGILLEFEGQLYEVEETNTHVRLEKDWQGRERHCLDVRVKAAWREEGYQPREDGLL